MKLKYCLECGKALNKLDKTRYKCADGHDFWNNPKSTSGIVLIKNGKILVAKRAFEPHKGKYDFPGGFLEFGENPLDASRREVFEETGLKVGKLEYMGSFGHKYAENITTCDIIFASKQWSGTPKPQDDVELLEWKTTDFINSEHFAWKYPGLADKLNDIL